MYMLSPNTPVYGVGKQTIANDRWVILIFISGRRMIKGRCRVCTGTKDNSWQNDERKEATLIDGRPGLPISVFVLASLLVFSVIISTCNHC